MEAISPMELIGVAFDKKAYGLEYHKENIWQVKLNINRKTDADIVSKLMSVPNRLGYIKSLIRADIEKEKQ